MGMTPRTSALSRSRLRYKYLRDYAQAIFDTVREPLLVLDKDLRVKRMNKSFCRTFKVSPQETKNQFLYALGDGQWKNPKLQQLLDAVLKRSSQVQDFEVDHVFPHIGHQTMLLNARRIKMVGMSRLRILLAFEDVTARRQAERAMERLNVSLKSRSITDSLTSLNNRRGFSVLSKQYLELAHRRGKSIFLIYIDLDGLKAINDHGGHLEGDQTLIQAAQILRNTFRKSDIIARVGGDEFVVVTMENGHDCAAMQMERLEANLKHQSSHNSQGDPISLSVGVVQSNPNEVKTIEELLAQADALMYIQKRDKHRSVDVLSRLRKLPVRVRMPNAIEKDANV